jgi:hypothetical protein
MACSNACNGVHVTSERIIFFWEFFFLANPQKNTCSHARYMNPEQARRLRSLKLGEMSMDSKILREVSSGSSAASRSTVCSGAAPGREGCSNWGIERFLSQLEYGLRARTNRKSLRMRPISIRQLYTSESAAICSAALRTYTSNGTQRHFLTFEAKFVHPVNRRCSNSHLLVVSTIIFVTRKSLSESIIVLGFIGVAVILVNGKDYPVLGWFTHFGSFSNLTTRALAVCGDSVSSFN